MLKCFFVTMCCVLALVTERASAQTSTVATAQVQAPAPKIKLYYVLFYYRGPKRIVDTAVLNPLQRQHMAHIDQHYKLGTVGIAGPFGGKEDLRGMLILQGVDEAGAKAIGDTDPMVKVGHLRYEVKPWYSEPGYALK